MHLPTNLTFIFFRTPLSLLLMTLTASPLVQTATREFEFQNVIFPAKLLFSVRISSKKLYNGGLFIADFWSTPHGCSTWPAWWSVGPNWPNGGEIDSTYPQSLTCNRPLISIFVSRRGYPQCKPQRRRTSHRRWMLDEQEPKPAQDVFCQR